MLALALLVLAVATPSVAPQPAPTNPFNLDPVPRPTTLPVIGTTRSRPVCTALRKAVKPALQSAMHNDAVYGTMRSTIYDYIVKDTEEARDLRLVQMDSKVQDLVKSTDALDDALKDASLDTPATAKGDDARALGELRKTLKGVLEAQRVQLDVMSGFVETERARRFGTLDESQKAMQSVSAPPGAKLQQVTGFLNDTNDTFSLKHPTMNGMAGGRKIDRDLGDIAAFTSRREAVATQAIVAAANACR